jgi:hypothetical protein
MITNEILCTPRVGRRRRPTGRRIDDPELGLLFNIDDDGHHYHSDLLDLTD